MKYNLFQSHTNPSDFIVSQDEEVSGYTYISSREAEHQEEAYYWLVTVGQHYPKFTKFFHRKSVKKIDCEHAHLESYSDLVAEYVKEHGKNITIVGLYPLSDGVIDRTKPLTYVDMTNQVVIDSSYEYLIGKPFNHQECEGLFCKYSSRGVRL